MAFCEIASDELVIKINSKGAELAGLYQKGHRHNWIWSAEEPWQRVAPHLFPIVGKLSGNVYRSADKEYKLSQHGFARDSEFEVVSASSSSVEFRLLSNARTRLVYPFDFSLDILYQVKGAILTVRYRVQNLGLMPLYFNIGWHPGFVLPGQGILPLQLVGSRDFGPCHSLLEGLVDTEQSYQVAKGVTISIDSGSFSNDAWVFLGDVPESLELSDAEGNSIVMKTGQAPFLGVWSKDPSKFVCIEPWWGVADLAGFVGPLESKYGIQSLESGQKWQVEMSVEIRGVNEGR